MSMNKDNRPGLGQVVLPLSFTLVSLLTTWIVLIKRRNNARAHKATNGIPGDMGLPGLGETLSFGAGPFKFAESRIKKHGPVFRSNVLGNNMVIIAGLHGIDTKEILALTELKTDGPSAFGFSKLSTMKPLLEGTLFSLEGKEYAVQRRMANSVLSTERITRELKNMAQTTNRIIGEAASLGRPTNFTEVIVSIIWGFNSPLVVGNMSTEKRARVRNLTEDYSKGFLSPPFDLGSFSTYGRAKIAFRNLTILVAEEVEERRKAGKSLSASNDLIQLCSDYVDSNTKEGIPAKDIGSSLGLICFAAIDTTFSTISSLMYLLNKPDNLHIRKRLIEEHFRVFGDDKTADQLGDDPDLFYDKLPQADAVIAETFRKRNPFANSLRQAKEDIKIPGTEYIVPKGYFFALALRLTYQNDERYFDHPKVMDIDRFLDGGKNAEDLDYRHTLQPFGKGNHSCVGKSVALALLKMYLSVVCRRAGKDGSKWPELYGDIEAYVETPAIWIPKMDGRFY